MNKERKNYYKYKLSSEREQTEEKGGTFLVLLASADDSSTAQHHDVLETILTSWGAVTYVSIIIYNYLPKKGVNYQL